MYQRKSRMTARQQSRLLEHFVAGTTARAAAELVGVQRTTAIKFYHRLRKLIASKLPSYELSGEVEAGVSVNHAASRPLWPGGGGVCPKLRLKGRRGRITAAY